MNQDNKTLFEQMFKKLSLVLQKNFRNAFLSVFIMMIIESIGSAIFLAPMMYFAITGKMTSLTMGISYVLLVSGVICWFSLQAGAFVLFLRMVRGDYVSIGFLFYGFRKFRQFAGSAVFFAGLAALVTLIIRLALHFTKGTPYDILAFLDQHFGEIYSMLVIAVILILLVVIISVRFLFLFFVRYDNAQLGTFRSAEIAAKQTEKKIFLLIRFVLKASARHLVLAAFYFAAATYFGLKTESAVQSIANFLFGFLYILNIYKALVMAYFATATFYDETV